MRQLHNEVEARLEEAPRAELHANQDRELGHKIEQQMQFRDTMAADNLEALAAGLLSQDPAKLAEVNHSPCLKAGDSWAEHCEPDRGTLP